MGNDLPDYQISVDTGTMEASSLKNGADAAKSASPGVGDVYLATDSEKLYACIAAAAWGLYFLGNKLFDANTILKADSDDTPEALTIAASRIVGRAAAGSIAALTGAQVMAILSGQASAAFSMNSQKITSVTDPTAAQDAATKNYVDDHLNDVSQSEPARALATNYQNTGGKIRVVCVSFNIAASGQDYAVGKIGSSSPATTIVAVTALDQVNYPIYSQITMIVPPNYYYRVENTFGDIGIEEWIEYDLH